VGQRKAWSKTCSYFGEGGRGKEVYLRFYVGELPIFHISHIGEGPIKWFFWGGGKKDKNKLKA